jgi:hypothetical protein
LEEKTMKLVYLPIWQQISHDQNHNLSNTPLPVLDHTFFVLPQDKTLKISVFITGLQVLNSPGNPQSVTCKASIACSSKLGLLPLEPTHVVDFRLLVPGDSSDKSIASMQMMNEPVPLLAGPHVISLEMSQLFQPIVQWEDIVVYIE